MGLGFSFGGAELGWVVFVLKTDLCQCVLTEAEMCKTTKAETALWYFLRPALMSFAVGIPSSRGTRW